MATEPSAIRVALTPRFQKDLRALAKRYRHIRSDLQPLIDQLQTGELPGVQVAGVNLTLYKVRLKNSDIQKGKSAGYRVIYYLKASDRIILVTVYSKSDRSDIDAQTLQDSISQVEQQIVEQQIKDTENLL